MLDLFDQQGGGVACTVKDPCLVSERLVVACSATAGFLAPTLLIVALCSFKHVSSALLFPLCSSTHNYREAHRPLWMISLQTLCL